MTITTARLALIADELESDTGFAYPANAGESGYWLRIAVALELIADIESELTGSVPEYMLRSCLALEVLSSVDGSAFNATEAGYVERMIASFEVLNSDTYEGTIGVKLLDAVTDFAPTAIGYVVHDSEIVTRNGLPIKSGTEVDVELADALAALTGPVTLGDGSLALMLGGSVDMNGETLNMNGGTLITNGGSIALNGDMITGDAGFAGNIYAPNLPTADGAEGLVWQDNGAARVLKVSAA